MATEPEANGSDPHPGPLTPAARRTPVPPEPPAPEPAADRPPPVPPPRPDPTWNLGDELEGLESTAEHVEVYAPPKPRPSPRPRPTLPAPPRELRAPRRAAAVISISLVGVAVLVQLVSVLSQSSGTGAAGDLSAQASRTVVAPGGRIELAGEGAAADAELVLEVRQPLVLRAPLALPDCLVLLSHARGIRPRQLAPAAAPAHLVLCLDHLLDVLALQAGLVLVGTSRPPVDEVGAAARVGPRHQDQHQDDEANQSQG